jgi:hypothetical protein
MLIRWLKFLQLLVLLLIAVSSKSLGQEVEVAVAADAAVGVDVQSLAEASRLTGKPVQRLVDIVRSDADASIVNGALRYICRRRSERHTAADTTQAQLVQGPASNDDVVVANWPANQNDSSGTLDETAVMKLHSRPAATRKVYLAFKGCITQVISCACLFLERRARTGLAGGVPAITADAD